MIDTRGIQKMLESLGAERQVLQERLNTLKERERTLQAWLMEEQPHQMLLIGSGQQDGPTPLSAFLQSALADDKPHTTAELAKLADDRGLIAAKKSPKRVVHFAMVALKHWDYVKRNSNGEWSIKK